ISNRRLSEPGSRLHWKTGTPLRAEVRRVQTGCPCQGCHGYRTCRESMLWVSCRRVVQWASTTQLARAPDTDRVCEKASGTMGFRTSESLAPNRAESGAASHVGGL